MDFDNGLFLTFIQYMILKKKREKVIPYLRDYCSPRHFTLFKVKYMFSASECFLPSFIWESCESLLVESCLLG